MSGNRIFRGPTGREPESINIPVSGAYLPGILCTVAASALIEAAAGDATKELLVLNNLQFADQDIEAAYANGDTGSAYRPETGQTFQVRLAAGNYAEGDELTVGANGRLGAAGADTVVLAYFTDTPGAYTAGSLADVRWGSGVKK